MRPELLTPARRSAPDPPRGPGRGRGPELLALAVLPLGALLLPGLLVPLALAVLFVGLLVGLPLGAIRAWQLVRRVRGRVRTRARVLLARPTP